MFFYWRLVFVVIAISSISTHALSHDAALKIGVKIWHNEGKGYEHNLITWNAGEPFLSLGLGHFIWTPAKIKHAYGNSFVELLRYFEQSGVQLPIWLRPQRASLCPWPNRAAFLRDHSGKKEELKALLQETMPLQIRFIVDRFKRLKPEVLRRVKAKQHAVAIQRLNGLLESEQGVYVLVDYLNFKGQGLSQNPEGWGLLQVVEQMARAPDALSDIEAFVWAADVVLKERATHDPSVRQWQQGWKNRVYGYLT